MASTPLEAARMEYIPFSGIRKVFEECTRLENQGRDLVHLEVGRPDFDTPSPIKEAGIEAIEDGHVHYTSNYGIPQLRRTIAEKYETENGVTYDPDEEVIVTAGGTEAYLITILALVDPGDEVLIPDPSWTYKPAINMAGGTPVRYDLDPTTGFAPDVEDVAATISDRTKLIVLNSPQNPTGGVVDESTLDRLAELVIEYDCYLISDEIYEKILFDDRTHHSPGSIPELFNRTVTINGCSKAYSMTGWRLGYLCAPQQLINPIIRIRQYTTTCASSIAQHAAVEAVGSAHHEPLVDAFEARRDLVMKRMEDLPDMDCPEPAGAFYAFPTIPEGYDDESFVFDLLEEQGVALVPGSVFSDSLDGRVRIAFSNSREGISEAFDRLERFLQ